MKGNVFQCHGESTNKQQFLKTVGVLDEHINKTFSYPQDIASICRTFQVVKLTQPTNLTKEEYAKDMGKRMIWQTYMKSYMKRTDMMESNMRGIYAIVWGQCSPMIQSKLKSLDHYSTKSIECDCIWLLKEIQGITHRFEGTRNIFISLDDAWCNYYSYKQGPNQSLHEYLKDYRSLVQVLEHYGAAIGSEGPYLDSLREQVRAETYAVTEEEYKANKITAAKQQTIAIVFLKRANKRRYGGLWTELENNFTCGQDHYPPDLTNAYNLLLNYKAAPMQQRQPRRDNSGNNNVSDMSFLQNGTPTPGTGGAIHERVKCYNCNTYGHYASVCPADVQEGHQMLQMAADKSVYQSEFCFAQADTGHNIIPNTWILLDSQSAVSVFKNRKLLSNIRPSSKTLRVHTNGGTQTSTEIGTVKNFGDIWFNTNSLANILSMADVRKVCRITMDTSLEAAMTMDRQDGFHMKFTEYKSGLYYFDTATVTKQPNLTSPQVKTTYFSTP
jgi:hypothetical protein